MAESGVMSATLDSLFQELAHTEINLLNSLGKVDGWLKSEEGLDKSAGPARYDWISESKISMQNALDNVRRAKSKVQDAVEHS